MKWLRIPIAASVTAMAVWTATPFLATDPALKSILAKAIGQALIISLTTLWVVSIAFRKQDSQNRPLQPFDTATYFRIAVKNIAIGWAILLLFPTVNSRTLSPEGLIREAIANIAIYTTSAIAAVALIRIVVSGHLRQKMLAAALALPTIGFLYLAALEYTVWFPAWLNTQ